MKIRMLSSVHGVGEVGAVVDVSQDLADMLVSKRMAVLAASETKMEEAPDEPQAEMVDGSSFTLKDAPVKKSSGK